MTYKLLADRDIFDLNEQVNKMLADGWQLYGNPITSSAKYANRDGEDVVTTEYCQALVKVEDVEIKEENVEIEDIPF